MQKTKYLLLSLLILITCGGGLFYFHMHKNERMPIAIESPLQALSMSDPYTQPDVININISELLAKHVYGGILVKGAWDRDDQGVFTTMQDADSFAQMKNKDGAPTPYYRAGKNVYIFKSGTSSKKTTNDRAIPAPVPIPGAEVDTFIPGITTEQNLVAKNRFHVYLIGVKEDQIDATSIELVASTSWTFKDKNHVYMLRTSIENPAQTYIVLPYDPKTFTALTENIDPAYFKDKNAVYFNEKEITGADINTFMVFTEPKLIEGKGANIFYSYSKDVRNVYFVTQNGEIEIVPNADPATFTPINTGGIYTYYCGKDKNAFYKGTTTIKDISSCPQ